MEASIVIVGDEILAGHVQDANASFIAARLAHHGRPLRRVQIVSDDPGDIAEAVARDLDDARIDMVFVCGGLGPTHDDRTMEGVAAAIGCPLVPCEPIRRRVEALVEHMSGRFSTDAIGVEGLRKMALAPEGAEAIESESGVIPAVTLVARDVRLIILPGPPRELQAVFTETVEPAFLDGTGTPVARLEIEHWFPESALAAVLTAIDERMPSVKIGSYPIADRVLIRIAGPVGDTERAHAEIAAAIDALSQSEDGKAMIEMMHRRRSGS